MPPTVWFAIVVSSLLAVALVGLGGGNRPRDTT